jgi:hypothetical protein
MSLLDSNIVLNKFPPHPLSSPLLPSLTFFFFSTNYLVQHLRPTMYTTSVQPPATTTINLLSCIATTSSPTSRLCPIHVQRRRATPSTYRFTFIFIFFLRKCSAFLVNYFFFSIFFFVISFIKKIFLMKNE